MLTLYYAPNSCSSAAHITLEETGAPYTANKVNFATNEQHGQVFRTLNPKGKVPVLCDDGEIITENVAIQYHLAHKFPEKALCPADPLEKVKWLSMVNWLSSTVQPDARHITRPENYTDDPDGIPAVVARGHKTVTKLMKDIDDILSRGPWIMGARYTTADPYALIFVGVAKKNGVLISKLGHIRTWVGRLIARPAVRTVLEAEGNVLLNPD